MAAITASMVAELRAKARRLVADLGIDGQSGQAGFGGRCELTRIPHEGLHLAQILMKLRLLGLRKTSTYYMLAA